MSLKITNKLISGIVNHLIWKPPEPLMYQELEWIQCLSSAAPCCSVWFLWPQPVWRLQASFSPTLLRPGFHFPPKAASPTVMAVDKQADIAAIVARAANANLREIAEDEGEARNTIHSSAWVTGTTDPAILESQESMCTPTYCWYGLLVVAL